jgi:hypothetical protein
MREYILLMHGDAENHGVSQDGDRWAKYLATLRESGVFDGGSSIGPGQRLKSGCAARPADTHIVGFIRIRAASLEEATRFLEGNPTYEAGGTVEIRELPRD